jgi:Uma2 family endonuclease
VIFEDEKTGDIHVVQPDIVVICNRKFITEKGYKGVPKLIVEVLSPSSVSVDYIKKMQLYGYFGVCEYWIVNPRNKSVQVFVLDNGVYIEYTALSQKGIVKSAVFENLEFDIENVFNF